MYFEESAANSELRKPRLISKSLLRKAENVNIKILTSLFLRRPKWRKDDLSSGGN